jgi:hypothetical protein
MLAIVVILAATTSFNAVRVVPQGGHCDEPGVINPTQIQCSHATVYTDSIWENNACYISLTPPTIDARLCIITFDAANTNAIGGTGVACPDGYTHPQTELECLAAANNIGDTLYVADYFTVTGKPNASAYQPYACHLPTSCMRISPTVATKFNLPITFFEISPAALRPHCSMFQPLCILTHPARHTSSKYYASNNAIIASLILLAAAVSALSSYIIFKRILQHSPPPTLIAPPYESNTNV